MSVSLNPEFKRILKAVLYSPLSAAARIPVLQGPMFAAYWRLFPDRPWTATHPFDRRFGTDTSGFVPAWMLQLGLTSNQHGHPYAGCHPTCIRDALSTIPDPARYSFIDMGCGKGRAMIVASEFPFLQIVGLELSEQLVKVANRNAEIIGAAYPGRTPIRPQAADAVKAALPAGARVVFFYHSFGRTLLEQVVSRLGQEAAAQGEELFFIYENPVFFDILDAAPGFSRWYAASVPCEPEERGFAADDHEVVAIWRFGGPPRTPLHDADTPLVVTKPGWRAEFAHTSAAVDGA
jgi:hypothetical protein